MDIVFKYKENYKNDENCFFSEELLKKMKYQLKYIVAYIDKN